MPVTGHILPQALHNMLHVVSVDVVSFQQAAVAGALHSKLQKHKRKLINQFVLPGMVHA